MKRCKHNCSLFPPTVKLPFSLAISRRISLALVLCRQVSPFIARLRGTRPLQRNTWSMTSQKNLVPIDQSARYAAIEPESLSRDYLSRDYLSRDYLSIHTNHHLSVTIATASLNVTHHTMLDCCLNRPLVVRMRLAFEFNRRGVDHVMFVCWHRLKIFYVL